MDRTYHIALVGCGFAGTSALFQLVDRWPVRKITVFEASGRFGPGYPYAREECPDYLINNTTGTMCLTPSNRRAFAMWLRGRPDLLPEVDEEGHLPRRLYGAFLKDVVAAARTAAAIKGIAVDLVAAEVTDIEEDAEGRVTLRWPGGEVTADKAILTTGRCPNRTSCPTVPPGMTARVYPTHIPGSLLDDIPLDATCHVLGASLSAYDVVNTLFGPATGCRFVRDAAGEVAFEPGPNERHVVIASRSGRLKKVEARRAAPLERRHATLANFKGLAAQGELTLAALLDLVRRDGDLNGADLDWHAILDPYGNCGDAAALNDRARTLLEADLASARAGKANGSSFLVDLVNDARFDIWDAFASGLLPPAEERAYRTRFETAMLAYAAPCPIPTAERVLALMRAGRLTILEGAGRVTADPATDAFLVPHRFGTARARILIDVTGAVDRKVSTESASPLVAALCRRGLLRPYAPDGEPFLGAAVDMTTFRAEGSRSIHLANMLLWGPGFFTSSAYMMATVVERILTGMFAPAQAGGGTAMPVAALS